MKIENWPYFDSETLRKVNSVLSGGKVNYWTGTEGKIFEKEFAKWCGTKFAIGISNGSLSLSCCYLAAKLKNNDEIITTPRTFIATASSAVLLNLKPIFADVDIESGNITAKTIEPLITKKTRAISIVHLGGWPAEMHKIRKLANAYNLILIEDCAQAHGAGYFRNGIFESVGSLGDLSSWSFCQDKIISTGGEGGMVTTNNKKYWNKIWSFKDHGKSFDKVSKKDKDNSFKWLHDDFGSNFRITEIQSAIGRIQLKKLYNWNKVRERNANILARYLKDLDLIRLAMPKDDIQHAWYKFYCYLRLECLSDDWDRLRIIEEIKGRGYPAFVGGCSEIYLEKCFKERQLSPKKRLPNAKVLGETSLMFLVHPTISEERMISYSQNIREVLKKAMN